jgi:DNA polymerase-3 subunit epsilon
MPSDNPLQRLGIDAERWRDIRAALDASDRYQLVERFEPQATYHTSDGRPLLTALLLDVETTGLVAGRDRIIQLAIVPFTFEKETGRICQVERCRSWYEDPGFPIPEEVTALTGITDADVAGQRIDDGAVAALIARSVLVIAHNASFDRAFLEARLPAFTAAAWACSQRDVPWISEGLQSARLEWLAYKHCGLFYEAHRADIDCGIAVHLLTTTLPSGELAMQRLLHQARKKEARVWAMNSPFETKDALKARGYRWSAGEEGTPKAWYRDVEQHTVDEECAWLAQHVYAGYSGRPVVVPFDARLRYSPRLMRADVKG